MNKYYSYRASSLSGTQVGQRVLAGIYFDRLHTPLRSVPLRRSPRKAPNKRPQVIVTWVEKGLPGPSNCG